MIPTLKSKLQAFVDRQLSDNRKALYTGSELDIQKIINLWVEEYGVLSPEEVDDFFVEITFILQEYEL